MNFQGLMQNIGFVARKNAPQILTGIGITGMLIGTFTAVAATPKAIKKVEQKKEELQVDELPVKEVVKETASCYILPAIATATGIACIIGGCHQGLRRTAAAATTISSLQSLLVEKNGIIDAYKAKVRDIVDEKTAEKIDSDIRSGIKKEKEVGEQIVVVGKKGNVVYKDTLTGQTFDSNCQNPDEARNKLYSALNAFNDLVNRNFCTTTELSYFMDAIGEPVSKVGDIMAYKGPAELWIPTPYALGDGTIVMDFEYRTQNLVCQL